MPSPRPATGLDGSTVAGLVAAAELVVELEGEVAGEGPDAAAEAVKEKLPETGWPSEDVTRHCTS